MLLLRSPHMDKYNAITSWRNHTRHYRYRSCILIWQEKGVIKYTAVKIWKNLIKVKNLECAFVCQFMASRNDNWKKRNTLNRSYLTDRGKSTVVNGMRSADHLLNFGVPQGFLALDQSYLKPLSKVIMKFELSFMCWLFPDLSPEVFWQCRCFILKIEDAMFFFKFRKIYWFQSVHVMPVESSDIHRRNIESK